MKQYTIVVDWNGWRSFELDVSQRLNDGWQCQGGVAFLVSGNDHGWAQAMTREAPAEGKPTDGPK